MNMPQISRGVLAAAVISLTLGAIPLAAGRDLSLGKQIAALNSLGTSAAAINRAAKADRSAGATQSGLPTRTISLQPNGLPATSVLVRVPVAQAARNGSPASWLLKSGDRKVTVACEPVVSVLTEVARQLQPGRCLT